MFRVFGVVLGSALAIGALLHLTGVHRIAPTGDPPPTPTATESRPAHAAPEPVGSVEAPAAIATAAPGLAAAVALAPEPLSHEPAGPEPQPEPETQRWHAFWSPFRSRIAANGFVAQLQRVTALDYRVVNIRPGVYEVAFAYGEDGEIAENLAQIAAATGLDLPGS